jgi:hypothetical protein
MESVIQQDREHCYLCEKYMTDRHKHHVFGAANRNNSERFGLTVYLCPECHAVVHARADISTVLKEQAQRVFEREHRHAYFMDVFGRNYLEVHSEDTDSRKD